MNTSDEQREIKDSAHSSTQGQNTEDTRITKRRNFLKALALTAAAVSVASPFVKISKIAGKASAQGKSATASALKQEFSDQAHAALDDTLASQGIADANLASEATIIEAATAGVTSSVANRAQTAITATLILPSSPQSTRIALSSPDPPIQDPITRMQEDLTRALAKPMEQRKWGMVIDLRKCVGCSSCTVACKAENKLPPGVVYRPVIVNEVGTFPNVSMQFVPRPCMQCENPPCVPVCPVGATFKRPDGIVAIDYDVCIGCRYCITACPYQARTFDFGLYYTSKTPELEPYETDPSFEYGEEWPRHELSSPIDNARKCHFCVHRLEAGMLPACVTTCIGVATYFGDLNDPNSLVSELVGRPNVMRLKEELGTEPKVYYLT